MASTAYALTHWVFPDVVHAPVSRAEYKRAQSILELPPGYTWPAIDFRADTVMVRGGGGSMAVSIDQSAWECYWVGAIKRGDTAAATRAQGVLADLMRNRISVAPKRCAGELGTDEQNVPVARLRRRRRVPVQAADLRGGSGRKAGRTRAELPGEPALGHVRIVSAAAPGRQGSPRAGGARNPGRVPR